MAVMVQAAVKLSQTPEEAIILMPGDMQNNMKASRALKMTTDSIKKEAESIRAQMAELAELKEKVSANKIDAEKRKTDLEEQRKILKAQIAEHNATQAKIMGEQKEAKAKAQSLAKKAQDLKGLIESLEQEKIEQRIQASQKTGDEIEADTNAPSGYKGKLRSFKSAKGKIRVPAAGRLVQKFGENGRNDTSKGVTISTRANAQVTAPFDAEVIFTGPFMDYGRVIILRHSDGFHTLLSGLARIDASVGNYLLEGEPLGNMGERDQSTKLYMELREDNNPINPAPWVKGMNK
jgi:septal ring factor EnvC (AmiA/AmiB activator)